MEDPLFGMWFTSVGVDQPESHEIHPFAYPIPQFYALSDVALTLTTPQHLKITSDGSQNVSLTAFAQLPLLNGNFALAAAKWPRAPTTQLSPDV